MKLRSLSLISITLAVAGALVFATSGSGKTERRAGGTCGSAPCWTTFTVNGNPAPAGVSLSVSNQGSNLMVQVTNSGQNELSPAVTTSDTIHMVLNIGTYDPVVFGTTGLITAFSESTGATNTLDITLKPRASSWNSAGCTTQSCGSDVNPVTATNDFSSVVLGFVSDMSTSGASDAVKNAMRGTWFATNAQSMVLPTFNASNDTVGFTVAAPHFKTDGSTINTGFFDFFAPDALVQQMGIADPSSVTGGSFTIASSNGVSTSFSVTHEASPAGVVIDAPSFNYSSPTFTVSKTAAPAVVVTKDTSAPTLSNMPDSQTLEATGPAGAQATFSFPTASDDRDGARPTWCDHFSGEMYAIGTTKVTCSASDTSGNFGFASFTVTVKDATAPTLSLPPGPTAEATGPHGAVVSYSPSATDLVDGSVAVTCSPASGATFPLGATPVSCSASDAHGNTAAGSFTVTIKDTTPPALAVPHRVSMRSERAVRVRFSVSAKDTVSGKVPVRCAPASGALFRLGTTRVTCVAVDAAGNKTAKAFKVTVAKQ